MIYIPFVTLTPAPLFNGPKLDWDANQTLSALATELFPRSMFSLVDAI